DSRESRAGLPRADRHRHYDARRRLLPKRQHRRLHRRPGRQPVVHENDHAIADDGGTTTLTIQDVATFELQPLADRDLLDQYVRNPEIVNKVAAENLDAALGDGTHGEFRVTRYAEFAYEEHIQRRLESHRHLVCDGNPASREPEDDYIRSTGVRGQSSA